MDSEGPNKKHDTLWEHYITYFHPWDTQILGLATCLILNNKKRRKKKVKKE